jgi:signal transduction histidine kinase
LKAWVVLAALAIGVACLSIAIVFFERSSPDYAQDRDFRTILMERRDLDQDVVEHALEARFDLAVNYDQLAIDRVDQLRLESGGKGRIPQFLTTAERKDIEGALDLYAKLADERQVTLEHFKSENALLKNSVAYFPSVAADALALARNPALAGGLNELRAETLIVALRKDPRAAQAQRESIATVLSLLHDVQDPERGRVEWTVAHARLIAEEKTVTDALLRRLVDLPVDRACEDVMSRYEGYYQRASSRADVFGNFVSGLALILLLLVAFAVLRLERFARELRQANEGLELAVQKRTAELRDAMVRRDRLEIELRQAQKLEAVGQLASGIAHEINTPIQYVGDSVYFLRDAFADLIRIVDGADESIVAAERSGAVLPTFAATKRLVVELELDKLKADIPEAIERTLDGAKQVAHIVSAMKTFAHASTEKLPFNLNGALDNTLTVARNEYKYVADLETDFSDVPDVACNPSGVRQVFLNLIVNAAHAIADVVGDSGKRGVISVRTTHVDDSVVVSVSDTGGGIPEAIRSRIFDPFFTTKPPGKGSGQGLAIAQNIVDQHGGKLWFETQLDKGTTFFVRLPVEATDRQNPLASSMGMQNARAVAPRTPGPQESTQMGVLE